LCSSTVSAATKTAAPSRNAMPARHGPPLSYAGSKSSKEADTIRAPAAKASAEASTGFGTSHRTPTQAPTTSGAEATTAKTTAVSTTSHHSSRFHDDASRVRRPEPVKVEAFSDSTHPAVQQAPLV